MNNDSLEDALRRSLKAQALAVNKNYSVDAELVGHVRRSMRRSTARTSWVIVGAIAAAVVAIALTTFLLVWQPNSSGTSAASSNTLPGISTATKPITSTSAATVDGGLKCPSSHQGEGLVLSKTPRPQLRDIFVPPTPNAGVVCRYYGSGSGASASLLRTAAKLPPASLDKLTQLLNAVHRYDTATAEGPPSCPTDDGSVSLIIFGYDQGPSVNIILPEEGCQIVSNGAFEGFLWNSEQVTEIIKSIH